MGQLLPSHRSLAHRGTKDEQIAQELHHYRGEALNPVFGPALTRQEALETYTPRQLRLSFMLQTWNAKMDFRRDLISDVKTKEETFDVSAFALSLHWLIYLC
jgi:hypothetical protein